jgi:DNA-directed RNA polymerase specialized sigma24 family protein
MHEEDVQTLSLEVLSKRFQEETRRYRKTRDGDPRYGLEIVHRALRLVRPRQLLSDGAVQPAVYADEDARNVLTACFNDYIKAQLNKHGLRVAQRDPDDLLQEVWTKFWSVDESKRSFETLASFFSYLKLTAVRTLSAAVEQGDRRKDEQSIQAMNELAGYDSFADPAADPFTQTAQRRFQERWREIITDPLEQELLMLYIKGYRPREIAAELVARGMMLNGRLPDSAMVSYRIDSILERLASDPEIGDLLRAD